MPIKNEKVRMALLTSQETEMELSRSIDYDQKISLYDKVITLCVPRKYTPNLSPSLNECKLFVCYNDAHKYLRDEAPAVSTNNKTNKQQQTEDRISFLIQYIHFLKMSKTIEVRNEEFLKIKIVIN